MIGSRFGVKIDVDNKLRCRHAERCGGFFLDWAPGFSGPRALDMGLPRRISAGQRGKSVI